LPKEHAEFFALEFEAALGSLSAWENVLSSNLTKGFKRYLKLVQQNINFIKMKPYNILITATMSAKIAIPAPSARSFSTTLPEF